MEFRADDEPSTELDIDVRTASVIWTDRGGDDTDTPDIPEVVYTGCSEYEAIGLLAVGFMKLLMDNALPPDEEEEA